MCESSGVVVWCGFGHLRCWLHPIGFSRDSGRHGTRRRCQRLLQPLGLLGPVLPVEWHWQFIHPVLFDSVADQASWVLPGPVLAQSLSGRNEKHNHSVCSTSCPIWQPQLFSSSRVLLCCMLRLASFGRVSVQRTAHVYRHLAGLCFPLHHVSSLFKQQVCSKSQHTRLGTCDCEYAPRHSGACCLQYARVWCVCLTLVCMLLATISLGKYSHYSASAFVTFFACSADLAPHRQQGGKRQYGEVARCEEEHRERSFYYFILPLLLFLLPETCIPV